MSILEAMAAGKPVVASPVGAIPAVVQADRTGLLVEPGNVTGLYEAIKKLLDAPELRRNFGEAGRALINRNYSSVSMAQNYLRVYLEALSSRAVAEQN